VLTLGCIAGRRLGCRHRAWVPDPRTFAALALLVSGCAGVGAPVPESVLGPGRVDPVLVDPFLHFPLETSTALGGRVREAFDEVKRGAALGPARDQALAVLEADPGFQPAAVLAAEIDFLEHRAARARDRLQPVSEAFPRYHAASWVLALAADELGDVVLAYEALTRIGAALPGAAQRASELAPRAVEITRKRFDQALASLHFEAAHAELDRLRTFAGDDPSTLEATWRLARAAGETGDERAALERLVAAAPERRETVERLAELEIEAGSLRAGLARLESLADHYPEDRALGERVERAKFRWRFENFPQAVRALARVPELSRASFARLVFWLVPQVRYAPIEAPPVATDILDHAQRNEIVRVLNVGLLDVDRSVHRFAPERPVSRLEVLAALLRVRARNHPNAACLAGIEPSRFGRQVARTCDAAVRCGLLAESADCLAAAPVSGDQAIELFRLGLSPDLGD